ncbi:MAG: TonB-dependent receptor [Chitinophagaceae bacterium]|nr:TonB-dependent receptor [Chitinophagaceae bacterium]MCW5927240.1 TonB-dependent receptor [Chitinophagaceae bacterium]
MKRILSMAMLMLLALLYQGTAFAQQSKTIKGRVFHEETGQPLEGVSIIPKGGRGGASTREDGSFELEVSPAVRFLLVTSTGYEQREVSIADRSAIDIPLKPSSRQLDDIVVTGYSVQNKRFIAGSIATVNANDIKDIPAASFNQLLQGKAAGVTVTSNSGVPGGGITFRVRGSNSINASVEPLYIIDGIFISSDNQIQTGLGGQVQSNPLADLNPSDIESITVLKDANATAIYGSLGANGVVLVTTKKGKLNSRGKITANVAQGWSSAVKKFEAVTGPQLAELVNESVRNTAIDNGLDPTGVTLPFPDPASVPTYDRNSDLFRVAKTNNYEVSAQGGTQSSTYYASLGYLKQESIVNPSDFERYSARLNYDNNITRNFKLGTTVNVTRTWRNVSSNDNNPRGVINSAIFPRSNVPIYNEDGTFNRAGSFDNHIALIENIGNDAVGWRTIGSIYGELTLLPGLKFRSSLNIDNNDVYENNYYNTLIVAGLASNGSAASYLTKNFILTNEQLLTYIKTLGSTGKHNINALLGNTVNKVLSQSTSATGQGFATNNITAISDAATKSGSSSRSESNLISFFGKASYTFDGKYTVDGSLRADASSKFGVDNKWGYFPSGGITWRAGEESFIRDLNIFDELKFRASAGLSGNQNGIGSYAALGIWSSGFNYLETAGTAPTQLENRNLTWETTRQIDLGVEFAILRNKLSFSVDYYNKYTYDLLLSVPVPSRSGFTSYLQNYGAVRNKGFEVTAHSVNISNGNFNWTTDFNISFNNNKIEKLAADIALGASGRNVSILREGNPVNSFQLYKQLYVDPETGNAVYEDVNKDGVITSADRQIVGNALPNYTGGLTNNISYKNFEFNFFFYFQQGNKIMNMRDFFLVHGGTQNFIGFIPRQLERWQQPGDITDIPRLTTYRNNINQNGGAANNYGGQVANLSSRYLEDGSFIRLRNISLSYNVPASVAERIKTNSIKAYVQVSNLLTFTRFNGLDPEVSAQSSNQNTAGYDWATVPQPRTIQVGLNISF